MYEMFAWCTSIIAENDEGEIIHGRGNDYTFNDNFAGLVQPYTFEAEWLRDGKVLFRSIQNPGYLGVNTAVKPGKFSISLNQRNHCGKFPSIWAFLWYKATPLTWTIR
jgi:acid ceramidase